MLNPRRMVAFAVKEEPPLTMSAAILFIRYQRIYDLVFRLECEHHKCFPCSIIGAIKVQIVKEDPTFESSWTVGKSGGRSCWTGVFFERNAKIH
jgi:hypothetical protein